MADATLLTLDLARQTGWAEGELDRFPRLGTVRLTPEGAHYTDLHLALFRHLWDRFSAFPPRYVVIEAPMMRQRNPADEGMRLIGLATTAALVCRLKGIPPPIIVHPSTVRAFFIGGHQFIYKGHALRGSGNLDSEASKFCVMERCRRLGLDPKNYDESDAAALWYWRAAQLRPALATELTPLFAGAAE
ncbi:hypothetical protein OSH11_11820 [Kaistia dalseonensis]|uniref:Uncharacterized protein n=1 Tax=Kaistia dalseonensis TaxID=410840 RepID=A0ABU0H910_9HYPH|nr:hypothetical protein [Kaistia dalseonensis]MCX5495396.1 hypothetical protein [Kaistia dalseonensis]MDQ0437984.1 hypothetical protein [Kaistia dalseonensis]